MGEWYGGKLRLSPPEDVVVEPGATYWEPGNNNDDLEAPTPYPESGTGGSYGQGLPRKRQQRPEWTRQEEEVFVRQHCIGGNSWSAIADLLPGRTAAEVKNIWHSTARARHVPRSLLRSYVLELQARDADSSEARAEAYHAAKLKTDQTNFSNDPETNGRRSKVRMQSSYAVGPHDRGQIPRGRAAAVGRLDPMTRRVRQQSLLLYDTADGIHGGYSIGNLSKGRTHKRSGYVEGDEGGEGDGNNTDAPMGPPPDRQTPNVPLETSGTPLQPVMWQPQQQLQSMQQRHWLLPSSGATHMIRQRKEVQLAEDALPQQQQQQQQQQQNPTGGRGLRAADDGKDEDGEDQGQKNCDGDYRATWQIAAKNASCFACTPNDPTHALQMAEAGLNGAPSPPDGLAHLQMLGVLPASVKMAMDVQELLEAVPPGGGGGSGGDGGACPLPPAAAAAAADAAAAHISTQQQRVPPLQPLAQRLAEWRLLAEAKALIEAEELYRLARLRLILAMQLEEGEEGHQDDGTVSADTAATEAADATEGAADADAPGAADVEGDDNGGSGAEKGVRSGSKHTATEEMLPCHVGGPKPNLFHHHHHRSRVPRGAREEVRAAVSAAATAAALAFNPFAWPAMPAQHLAAAALKVHHHRHDHQFLHRYHYQQRQQGQERQQDDAAALNEQLLGGVLHTRKGVPAAATTWHGAPLQDEKAARMMLAAVGWGVSEGPQQHPTVQPHVAVAAAAATDWKPWPYHMLAHDGEVEEAGHEDFDMDGDALYANGLVSGSRPTTFSPYMADGEPGRTVRTSVKRGRMDLLDHCALLPGSLGAVNTANTATNNNTTTTTNNNINSDYNAPFTHSQPANGAPRQVKEVRWREPEVQTLTLTQQPEPRRSRQPQPLKWQRQQQWQIGDQEDEQQQHQQQPRQQQRQRQCRLKKQPLRVKQPQGYQQQGQEEEQQQQQQQLHRGAQQRSRSRDGGDCPPGDHGLGVDASESDVAKALLSFSQLKPRQVEQVQQARGKLPGSRG